jgi:hypothetical protein
MARRAIVLVLLSLLCGVSALYLTSTPGSPRALFEKRCGTCHKLPDLSGYRKNELAPLVRFMRTYNGAYRVISDPEAQTIITCLESSWPLLAPDHKSKR